ncbi:Fic family protein [Parapedobacter sp. SGR-10]|uniref:Fic family protein n=1 Tax=Parapedobacter sp. SGR-10 TaxID=2710879 RepID=UPI0013CF6D22|nr:Fic family protein [Parapedobacter sp. SGR-10]NGF54890.1 Fic family protein [Parapedobacter sp. SGR-10]
MKTHSLHITPEILSIIAAIDEFKGTWKVLGNLAPEQLTSLRKVATIESIGSSTRIEGSKLTDQQVQVLLSNLQIQKFENRDEQEVAGYAEVMNTVFEHYEEIPFTENYIRQLHKDLLKYSDKDYRHRGEYKKHSNQVEAFDAEGKSIGVIFVTASPFDTPLRMQHLVEWTNETLADRSLHPLLVTAIFVVEFLAIHPFQDGNGRLSRILTTYLLMRTGYAYVPYSSLEAIIEHSKEAYYLALRQTQVTLEHDAPDWQPWVVFFLKAISRQKQRLETKLEKEHLLLGQLPPLSLSILELVKSRGQVTNSEIVTITGANRNTVKKHLENLVSNRQLQKHGAGKGTFYTL